MIRFKLSEYKENFMKMLFKFSNDDLNYNLSSIICYCYLQLYAYLSIFQHNKSASEIPFLYKCILVQQEPEKYRSRRCNTHEGCCVCSSLAIISHVESGKAVNVHMSPRRLAVNIVGPIKSCNINEVLAEVVMHCMIYFCAHSH